MDVLRWDEATRDLRERQRRDWDRIAASVRDFHAAPSTLYYRRCEIALLERSLGSLSGKRVLKLDLWNEAFNTRILDWMREQGAEVVGLDISRVVAFRARRNARSNGHCSPSGSASAPPASPASWWPTMPMSPSPRPRPSSRAAA